MHYDRQSTEMIDNGNRREAWAVSMRDYARASYYRAQHIIRYAQRAIRLRVAVNW